MRWIKRGEEEKQAFENSLEITDVFLRQLKGRRWTVIRKIRLVRFIRRMIEEGIIVRGVREMYEEGCRILSEMGSGRGEELEEEGREEERYMCELYLLKVRGERERLKENEVSVLRREKEEAERRKAEAVSAKEEAERRREEAERGKAEAVRAKQEAENAKAEAERGRQDAERRREEAERRRAEEKRESEARIRQLEQRLDAWKPTPLDGISVISSDCVIKREGNTITHTGTDYAIRHCMIGGEMRIVCVC